jgi:uncharacterized protein (DUF983 family)
MSQKSPLLFPSLVSCKCPRCRKGRVFPYSAFNLFAFSKTNDNCPNCGLKFEHETGFFWAAMYISYAFSTIIMIVKGYIIIIIIGKGFNIIIIIGKAYGIIIIIGKGFSYLGKRL